MPVVVGSQLLARSLAGDESSVDAAETLDKAGDEPLAENEVMTYAQCVSGLHDVGDQLREAPHPDVLTSLEDPLASLAQSYLAETAEQTGHVTPLEAGGEEARYDDADHVIALPRIIYRAITGIILPTWRTPPAQPDRLGAAFRMAVLGDWGTGLYGAPVCARSIAAQGDDDQVTLHLGDVYYSGSSREIRKQFLERWPAKPGATRRAVLGNHEMYSGGHAYFNEVLPAFEQASSCFALENDDWLLVGLDTSFKAARRELFFAPDNDLYVGEPDTGQLAWLRTLIAGAGEKRIVLFSHHQPFSYFDRNGPTLVSRIMEYLESRRIFAWYWGHEHRCVLYDQHPEWGLFGRCVGHGGYPYYRCATVKSLPGPRQGPKIRNDLWAPTDSKAGWRWFPDKAPDDQNPHRIPPGLVVDGPNAYVKGHENDYGPNGFMTLEFNGPRLAEIVHEADGTILYQDTLT